MSKVCENCDTVLPSELTKLVSNNDNYDRDTIVVGVKYCPRCGEKR